MYNQVMTKTQQVLFVFFAVLSVPSAYMFGLSVRLGRGIASLLDTTFYTGEIFRFGLVVVFLSALFRPLHVLLQTTSPLINSPEFVRDQHPVWVWTLRLVLVAGTIMFIFLGTNWFIDSKLLPRFMLKIFIYFLVFSTTFILLSMVTVLPIESDWQEKKRSLLPFTRQYLSDSLNWKKYWSNPLMLLFNFSFVLLTVVLFGTYRMLTIIDGHPYCVVTAMGNISASIIGKTDEGIVVATANRDVMSLYKANRDYESIHFLSKSQVLSVHWDCASHYRPATTHDLKKP